MHPNDCNQGLQESEAVFVSCDVVKEVKRCKHTPTLFRMNTPEESNNSRGGSLVVAAVHPEQLFKEPLGQSNDTTAARFIYI